MTQKKINNELIIKQIRETKNIEKIKQIIKNNKYLTKEIIKEIKVIPSLELMDFLKDYE